VLLHGGFGGGVSLYLSEILVTPNFDLPCPFNFFAGGERSGGEPYGGGGGTSGGLGDFLYPLNRAVTACISPGYLDLTGEEELVPVGSSGGYSGCGGTSPSSRDGLSIDYSASSGMGSGDRGSRPAGRSSSLVSGTGASTVLASTGSAGVVASVASYWVHWTP
jgi:hypothetical protein